MPKTFYPGGNKVTYFSFSALRTPLLSILKVAQPLEAEGNRPLQMTFEDQLNALILFHLDEHESGRHLLQVLEEDVYAQKEIAPGKGIKKSAFFEAINTRGLEQMQFVFQELCKKASKILPKGNEELGDLVSIDGSLIDATLSMYWADYRSNSRKAKAHMGFDLNRGIPRNLYLTDGKGAERPFVSSILEPGQTGVMDRGYQSHKHFDVLQEEKKFFVCRIKESTHKTEVRTNEIENDGMTFYDAVCLLGNPGKNQTEKELRVVGYRIGGKVYWVATNRHDLTAGQIAKIYRLRWNIEVFFGWWKKHLKVYHLIARSEYGLMVQLLAGLITYLLLAIYCHEQYNEKVSIKRVRELRIKIKNESKQLSAQTIAASNQNNPDNLMGRFSNAIT
jgi:hypothetical protein